MNSHLGYFYFLAIMNNYSLNIHVQVFVEHMFSVFLTMYLYNGSTRSCGNSMFNFLKNRYAVCKGAASEGPISLYFHQHVLLSVFRIIVILVANEIS